MKKIFLKGYYGYKNLGDEILMLGVCDYFYQEHGFDEIMIEVDDKSFAEEFFKKNKFFNYAWSDKVTFIQKKLWFHRHGLLFSPRVLKVFGGGEVFAMRLGLYSSRFFLFIYGGWFVILKYFIDVLLRNYIIIGGIETPKKRRQKVIFSFLIPRAKQVIVREKGSYNVARKYRKNVTLYQDFAVSVIEKSLGIIAKKPSKKTSKKTKPYVLLNMHQKVANQKSYDKIKDFVAKYKDHEVFYVAAGREDEKFAKIFQKFIPDLKIYDWMDKSILEIVSFFKGATAGIGARLHFLMLLQECGTTLEPIVYAEKINKLILNKQK